MLKQLTKEKGEKQNEKIIPINSDGVMFRVWIVNGDSARILMTVVETIVDVHIRVISELTDAITMM